MRNRARAQAGRLVVRLLFAMFALAVASPACAQLSGTKSIPGDYPTLGAAITDLNTVGVGAGGVTLSVVPGNPQNAPAGGYAVTATGTVANAIAIACNGNTITASAGHTVGALNDAVFKLVGADFVTISGCSLTENAANTVTNAATNTMTEWGVALLYATPTNGAQNDTIIGNTIDLNRTYPNTFGIYANATHSATAVTTQATATGPAGGNSGLRIYGNTITDVNNGIVVIGPTAAADVNDAIEIGGSPATANTLTNFGTTNAFTNYANVGATEAGVLLRNSKNFVVSHNSITSSNGGFTSGVLNGIQVAPPTSPPTGTYTNQISNNQLSLRPGAAAAGIAGIAVIGASSSTSAFSINGNDFANSGHTVPGSGGISFIVFTAVGTQLPGALSISNNTFTNLSVDTTGSVTFIFHGGNLAAGGTSTVNGNGIVGTFAKTGAGGTVALFATNGASVNGSSMFNNNNNFSNITLAGATTFAGWSNTEGASATSAPEKTISGNTFSGITVGSSPVTVVTTNLGAATTVSNNTVSNISGTSSITGFFHGTANAQGTHSFTGNVISNLSSTGTGGNVVGIVGGAASIPTWNISGNTVSALSSSGLNSAVQGIAVAAGADVNVSGNSISNLLGTGTGFATATGILVSAGTTVNVSLNRVYQIVESGAITASSGAVSGIAMTGGTNVNAFNNLVADLRAPAAAQFDAVRGLTVSGGLASTFNLSFNTVLLTASSTGTNFGTSALFSLGTATPSQAALNLRNNVLVNLSTPSGSGFTVVHRRNGSSLANYGSASNNNDFYAGTPSASRLIYFDGTNADQTLAAYKLRVANRDDASVSESPAFLSTVGASAQFLHVDPSAASQLEGAGVGVAGITTDFDGDLRNGSTPDIGADEFNGIPIDLVAPAITYAMLPNTTSTANRTLAVTITDAHGVAGGALSPRIYFKKNAGANLSVACTGAAPTYSCVINNALVGGVTTGDVIRYFVVAQDTLGNVGANPSTGFAAVDVSNVSFPPTFPNLYTVVLPFPTTVNVGSGEVFTSLTNTGGLFETINNRVLTGDTTVNVTSDLGELGNVALNAIAESAPGGFTLTIRPSASAERVIAGGNSGGLIRLNSADRVVFDGRFAGAGRFLRFRNNVGGPTFVFQNDATANILSSSIVEGATASIGSGTIFFGSTTGQVGNSFNTIVDCDVRDRSDVAGVPANAIASFGTFGAPNADNSVLQTNVYNFSNAGVLLSGAAGGDRWTVDASNFYQTAARTTVMTAIALLGGSGHAVVNNRIGGGAPGAVGPFLNTSNTFRGIDLTVGTTPVTNVQGNVVKNIRGTGVATAASYGILVQGGNANIGTVAGNSIGSVDPNERYEINGDSFGIRVTSINSVNVSNNSVRNFTTGPAVPAGEFRVGISVEGTGGSHTVQGNTVANMTNGSTPSATFDTRTVGIQSLASGVQTIRGNTVRDSGNSVAAATGAPALSNRVFGMLLVGSASGTVVESNSIANVFASSASTNASADVVMLLQLLNAANATVRNNMFSTDGGSGSTDRFVAGIMDSNQAGAATTYLHNSVNLTGPASGANNSYAFIRNGTGTVGVRNNVFVNTRAGGTGFHVAMANTNAVASGWPATASDFNVLSNATPAHLTQWLGTAAGNSFDLVGFRAQSGGDGNSLNADPLYVAANDLHIVPASPANNAGTPAGVTADIDGQSRSTLRPDIGADEINVLPTILVGTLFRTAGFPGTVSGIAIVADADDAESNLVVTANGAATATVNGVTLTGITLDAAGNVSADIEASCSATNAAFTIRVTDTNAGFAENTLNVTVGPNPLPTLAYPASTSAVFGQALAVAPTDGPFDDQALVSIVVQGVGSYAGSASVDGNGIVSLTGAQPVGTHTLVIRATDTCSGTTDANLSLTVGAAATTTAITSDTPDPSTPGQNVVVAYGVSVAAPGTGTPAGNVTVSDGVNNCTGTVAAGQCTVALNTPGNRTLTANYDGNASFAGSTSPGVAHVVNSTADLAITKASNLSQATAGLIQYTLVASNAGPLPVTGATVADTIPAIVTGATWTCTGAGGGTCIASGAGNINQSVNLPVGATVTFAITGNIPTNPLPGLIVNTATVASSGSVTDANPANNSATVSDAVVLFRNGFEDGAGNGPASTLQSPAAGAMLAMPLDTRDVLAAAVEGAARDVALFQVDNELLLVSARRLAGDAQLRVLLRDPYGIWHAGEWTGVPPQQFVSLTWSRDATGTLQAGVRVE